MTKKQRDARERAAVELARDVVETGAGYEVDSKDCCVDGHEKGGDVWVTLRVRVPDSDIGDRVVKMAKEGR